MSRTFRTEDASIAASIEHLFNLGSLGAHDVQANDFSDVIDIKQSVPPFVPITSNQGLYVAPGAPAPTLPMGGFRVIPGGFAGRQTHGKPFFASADYYGARSADY